MKPVKRSFGVTVLAIVAILAGILGLLTAFSDFSGLNLFGGTAPQVQTIVQGALDGLVLVLSVLYIVFGIAALQLRGWAWGLGVALAILSVLDAGVKAAITHSFNSGDGFNVIIAVLILVYLYTPRVRQEFGRK
jgi:hypothetical protein